MWYKSFKLYGKKFFQMTKNKVALKSDKIIYYCHFHTTTIESNKLFKSCKIAKTSKCNARFFYFKKEQKYIY